MTTTDGVVQKRIEVLPRDGIRARRETGLADDVDGFYDRARKVAGGKLIVVGHSLNALVAIGTSPA